MEIMLLWKGNNIVLCFRYTKGVDIWSLGTILAEMLRGKPLFTGENTIEQINFIRGALAEPTTQGEVLAEWATCRGTHITALYEKLRPIRSRTFQDSSPLKFWFFESDAKKINTKAVPGWFSSTVTTSTNHRRAVCYVTLIIGCTLKVGFCCSFKCLHCQSPNMLGTWSENFCKLLVIRKNSPKQKSSICTSRHARLINFQI